MTFAYFCVLIAIFLPWLCAFYAKVNAGFSMSRDNSNPREFLAQTTGKSARANYAQQNSFEIFAPFAAAVIIAHLSGNAAQSTINFWALVFIVSRLFFIHYYIADKAKQRSYSWAVGALSIVMLFIAAF